MRTFIITFTLLAAATLVTACNTMSGAGEDISQGGQKLENAADRNK